METRILFFSFLLFILKCSASFSSPNSILVKVQSCLLSLFSPTLLFSLSFLSLLSLSSLSQFHLRFFFLLSTHGCLFSPICLYSSVSFFFFLVPDLFLFSYSFLLFFFLFVFFPFSFLVDLDWFDLFVGLIYILLIYILLIYILYASTSFLPSLVLFSFPFFCSPWY